jgi:hypothetical protein
VKGNKARENEDLILKYLMRKREGRTNGKISGFKSLAKIKRFGCISLII